MSRSCSRRHYSLDYIVGWKPSCNVVRGLPRVASVYLICIKLCAVQLSSFSTQISAFYEIFNMTAVRSLGFVGWNHGTIHEAPFTVAVPCENFVMIGIAMLKLKVFEAVVHAWKSHSVVLKFHFWWVGFQDLEEGRSDWEKAHPCSEWRVLGLFDGDRTRRVVALCISISRRRKFG